MDEAPLFPELRVLSRRRIRTARAHNMNRTNLTLAALAVASAFAPAAYAQDQKMTEVVITANRIARIDPFSGHVLGWIDLSGLAAASRTTPTTRSTTSITSRC